MAGTNGGYGRRNPRFTPEDHAAMRAAHDTGESVPSIAKRYACSPNTVYHQLRTTGRHVPIKELRAAASQRPSGPGACIRCGIDMGRPGMCLDCLEVEGIA